MLKSTYIMQQASDINDATKFSFGLVVVCLILLILLWLPGILKG